MEDLKYELIEVTPFKGLKYRVKALKDFDSVKKGDIGGYVNNEHNLSQLGTCWIYDNACAFGDSRIMDDAKMLDNAEIHSYAKMHDNTVMHDNTKMYSNAGMFHHTEIHNQASLYGNAKIYDMSRLYDNAEMHDHTEMHGESEMHDKSEMYDKTEMHGNSKMYGNVIMTGYATLRNYKLRGNDTISSYAYKYTAKVIYGNPIKIKMGCYTKTVDEWKSYFMNNIKEFPYGSEEALVRLKAFNHCMLEIDEPLLPKSVVLDKG